MTWKDQSSYRRGDTERKPNTLKCVLTDKIAFLVHKHIYYGDAWLLTCSFLGVEHMDLNTTDMEEAKRLAGVAMKNLLVAHKAKVDAAIDVLCRRKMQHDDAL